MSLQKTVRQEELVTGNKRVVPAFSNVCVCVRVFADDPKSTIGNAI